MNVFLKIGRFEFGLMSVIAVVKQDDDTYDVILPYNIRLNLTGEEKEQLDNARDQHEKVMFVMGAAAGAGARNVGF